MGLGLWLVLLLFRVPVHGERPDERVITVGIGWVLLASAASRSSSYTKLAYCSSSCQGAPVAQWQEHLTRIQNDLALIPSWVPVFQDFFYSLRKPIIFDEFAM